MEPVIDIAEAEQEAATLRFGRYLRWLFVLPVIFYLLPFGLLRIPHWEEWGGSTFAPAIEYGFAASGEDAKVVVIGDSGAMIGISPEEMSRELQLKVVNLPNTASSLPIVGEIELRHYLARNRAPQMIVLYLATWNLNFRHLKSGEQLYEGTEALIAHGEPGDIAEFARYHAMALLAFPFRFYVANPQSSIGSLVTHKPGFRQIRGAQGHFDPMMNHAAMKDGVCELPSHVLPWNGTESSHEFQDRFGSAQTKVLVYLAPIPSCANTDVLTKRSYEAIGAAPPALLPPADFKEDGSYNHLVPGAVNVATKNLSDAVRQRLQSPPNNSSY